MIVYIHWVFSDSGMRRNHITYKKQGAGCQGEPGYPKTCLPLEISLPRWDSLENPGFPPVPKCLIRYSET